jgi:VanZ family protein
MTAIRRNNAVLSLVCLSIIILILFFGLWPFNLNPPNEVFWLKEGPGVRINGPGYLFSLQDLSQDFPDRNISLELWICPAKKPNTRLPQIFSLWDGTLPDLFLIGQWKDSLILRARSLSPKAVRGYRERGSSHALIKDRKIFLTLTSFPAGTTVYQNGEQVKEFPGYPLLENRPVGKGAFILGNSSIGKSYWEGRIYGLALYKRGLSNQEVLQNYSCWSRRDYQTLKSLSGLEGLYTFDERIGDWAFNLAGDSASLYKPVFFHPLQKVILEWPSKEYLKRLRFYQDMSVNVLGFIPLGFFLALWLFRFTRLSSSAALALTFLFGTLISLGIELGQVYLPIRDSSASDLIFNCLGTLIGIGLLHIILKRNYLGSIL